MKILQTLILLFITFLPAGAAADGPPVPQSAEVHLSKHHEKSRNATVKVKSQFGHGTGTYVKVGKSYGILTAAHVVDDGSNHYIIEAGLHQSIATLIWKDEDSDVAFLVTEKIDKLSSLKIASYPDIRVGEQIIYSGFPSSHEMLTFSCQIANPSYNGMIAIQGWAWFGSSGSGFINKKGRVFAVLSAVNVESFYGHPQVLETLVYGAPIREHMITQIQEQLNIWKENQ